MDAGRLLDGRRVIVVGGGGMGNGRGVAAAGAQVVVVDRSQACERRLGGAGTDGPLLREGSAAGQEIIDDHCAIVEATNAEVSRRLPA